MYPFFREIKAFRVEMPLPEEKNPSTWMNAGKKLMPPMSGSYLPQWVKLKVRT